MYGPTNGVILPAGTNTLTVLFTPTDTNYGPTNLSVQLVVDPAPLTITANSTNKIYGQTLTLGAGQTAFTSSGLVIGDSVTSVTLTSAGAGSGAPVGTYSIVPSAAVGIGLTNYSLSYSNGVLTVGLGNYTANWATPTNIVYGTPLGTNENDATATVGGTYVYGPTNGVILPAGTNTLTVLFTPTDTNYGPTNLSVQLVVDPAPLTITANSTNKIYGQTLTLGAGQTAFTSSGLVIGDSVTSVTLTSAGAGSGAPVGTYSIVPSAAVGIGLTNYSLSYSNGVLTVGLGNYTANWATPTNIVYGTPLGTNENDATATVGGTYVYGPTNGVILPAGTNTLTVLFTPTDTNYGPTNLSVQLVVDPAPLTITANSTNKIYGQTLTLGAGQTAFTSSGLVIGDSVTSVTLTSAGAGSGAPVGTYSIVPSAAVGIGLTNYSLSYSNGVLTVGLGNYTANWATPTNIVYGTPLGTNQNDATATLPGNFSYNPTNGTVPPVGTNTLHVVFTPTDTNYVATNLTVQLVVLPAPLTVTASNVSRLYGQTNPVLGGTITGIQNGDNITATFTTTAVTNSPVGTYPIVPHLVDPNGRLVNYTVTTNNGTLTVNAVTPTANGQSVNIAENTATAITLAGSDPAGQPLTYIIVTAPTNGVLTLFNTNTGAVTYTPNTNFAGADSFTFKVNNGQTNSAPATVSITVTPVADLVVVQSGPTNAPAGSNLVFTVSVTNRGPAAATSLVISNQLATGFTFVSASSSGSNNAGLVSWNISSLPVNGVTNLTVTLVAAEGGTLTNIASGASALPDLNPTNNNGSLPNARSVTVITSLADVAVFKSGGTNVVAGGTVNYTITVTNSGPSTASNVVVKDNLPAGATFQSASGSYVTNSGVVTWSGMTLAKGATASYTLTLTAPVSGAFVNTALSTSDTPDSNTNNNNGSAASSKVTTAVTPSADVIVLLSGPGSSPLGSNIVYSITVSNAGPSTASNVIVKDTLSPLLAFSSASGGGTNAGGTVTWPTLAALLNGGSTNFTLTVIATNSGVITNIAFATAATFDPNLTNNNGTLPASQAQTVVAPTQFHITAGTNVTQIAANTYRVTTNAFNPQTGLYEELVTVTNTGTTSVAGVRLFVSGLPSGVTLYNATGTNGGTPYAEYDGPLNPTNTVPPFAVTFALEFYDPLRVTFTNSVTAVAIIPPATVYTGTNGSVAINSIISDYRSVPPRIIIEFSTIPGTNYVIIYKDSLTSTNWLIATPSITANANITQWYDDGPPKTTNNPAGTGSRFYRVIQY